MALTGTLRIAGPYDEDTIRNITGHFSALLSTEVTFSVSRDDSLIGGFTAIVDNKLYDSSILSRLGRLEQHLTK